MRSSKALLLLSLATLLVFAAFSGMWAPKANAQESTSSPTIQSDKEDYAPGELVTLTGSNWQPDESVNIWVNDSEGDSWKRNVDVTADSSGNITDTFNLPDWFVATYNVTATGTSSGTATTSFTDSVAATGSVDNRTSFRNTTGNEYRFTINNTSTASESIGSIQITKPGGFADDLPTSGACTTTEPGWTATRQDDSTCRFTSGSGTSDNIPASRTSDKFSVKADIGDGDDVSATWGITVRTTDNFSGGSGVTANTGASAPGALTTSVYSFEVTDAVVAVSSSTIGSACPASNKTATAGSTRAIVICGIKHRTSSLTPVAGSSSLGGTMLASTGTFGSGSITATGTPVVLANYTGATISSAGTGKTIDAKIGSSSSRTSPLKNLTGYEAQSPVQATSLTVANASGTYGETTGLSATLKSPNASGTGVSGKTITFKLNGSAVCGGSTGTNCPTTNSSGVATLNGVSLAGINAGSYSEAVQADFAGDSDYSASSGKGNLTVDKANQTIDFAELEDATYGDAPFTVSASSDSGLEVSFAADGECTIDSNDLVSITGAGSCTITASQAGNDNYNPATNVDRTFTIGKANQTITFDTLANKTYGDAAFDPGASASSGLAVSYTASPQSVCSIVSGNVHINGAGECTVTASQAGDDNYNAASDVVRSFTVARAAPTITWNNPADITYGTALNSTQLNATANVPGSFTYSPDSGTVLNAGNGQVLTANFTPTDTTNYSTPNPKTVSINVLKANQTIDFAELADAAYDDDPISLSATASSGLPVSFMADGNCELDEDGTTLSITGVGTCEVTASQEGDSNYEAAQPVSHSFSIEKATATVELGNLSQTYDGSPKPVSIVTDPENLTVDVTYDGSATPPTNAGSYAVVAEVDDDNYEGSDSGTLVIAKANQVIDFDELANATYGDEPLELEATASSGLPVSFAASSESDCTVSGSTVTITGAGSCTITASQEGDDNYEAAEDVSRTFAIDKAMPSITWNNPENITYGTLLSSTQLNAVAYGVDGTELDGVFAYDPDEDAKLNVGTHALSATFTPDDTKNYYEANAAATIVVEKASQEITFDALANKTYGDPDFAVSASSDSDLPVIFSASGNCSVDGNVVTITGAGSCTITASQEGDSNYNAAEDVSQTFQIEKAKATVTLSDLSHTYDGSPKEATATASPAGLTGVIITYNGSSTAPTNAGTYAVEATLDNANYTAEKATGTLEIAKAAATIELSGLSHTYDGSAKEASYKTYLSSDTTKAELGLSGVTISYFNTDSSGNKTGSALQSAPTNAGRYVVEATLDNANYQAEKATGTLVIAKADGSVSINNIPSNATFGGSFTPTYTQAGDGTASTTSNTPSVCSVSSQGVVSFDAAGTCKLQASVMEGTNHRAATGNEQSFTVSKANQAALTVTQPNSGTYGDKLEMAASGGTTNEAVTFNVVAGSTACQIDANNKLDIKSGTGTCKITATRAGNANYDPVTSAEHTVTVAKRQANVVYTGENYKAIASAGNATINLSAQVSRTSGNLGDLSLANVEFTVKKYNGAVQTTVQKIADANGNAATTASVPTSDDPYTVEVRIAPANLYWTSGIDVGSLQVIVGSGTGRTAGGGWIPDATNTINGKSNFGFSVQNSKTGIKGNSLFIYRAHEESNEVQYVVKSNSWQGGGLTFNVNNDAAKATFTGKATVQRYVNGVLDTAFSGGNHTFTVDDFDGDLKNPKQKDAYAITVRNSANQVVKQLGSRTTPVTLGGGNVLVQKK